MLTESKDAIIESIEHSVMALQAGISIYIIESNTRKETKITVIPSHTYKKKKFNRRIF